MAGNRAEDSDRVTDVRSGDGGGKRFTWITPNINSL